MRKKKGNTMMLGEMFKRKKNQNVVWRHMIWRTSLPYDMI